MSKMKRSIIICVLALMCAVVFGQNGDDYFRTLEKGDLSLLEKNMATDIELCIQDSPDFYSKKAALKKISHFLKSIDIKSCESIHSGQSGKKAKYWVGKLVGAAQTYRVFLYHEGGKIIEVRFDNF